MDRFTAKFVGPYRPRISSSIWRASSTPPTPACAYSEPHGHHNGWHSRHDWWRNLRTDWASNWFSRQRSHTGIHHQCHYYAIYSNGIRRTWLGNAGSRRRVSVDKRRITTTKCVYQWLDGMVCAHHSRKPLCRRLWSILVSTPWPKRGWHII